MELTGDAKLGGIIAAAIHDTHVRNGKKGGRTTLKKHGVSHFAKASKKGVKARRRKTKKVIHRG